MRGERQRGAAHGNPYLEILRAPGAMAFSAAGVLARTPMAMFGLGTVLLIASVTGRYGVAGTVAAAGSVGYAACAPQAAKLADRFGQRRVLRPLALIFALSTIIFIGCAELRTPLWALLLSGAVAGASMPSLGSMVRARWSALLGDSPRLHTAFALESVNDEVIFVLGPVIVTILATEVYPASGVAAAMLLCVTGTLLLAAQRGTEPAPRNRPRPTAEPLPVMAPAPVTDAVAGAGPGRFRPPAAGLTALAPIYWCLGVTFAAIDLSTIAFAQEHGHKPLAGLILGSYALGSAVGGLLRDIDVLGAARVAVAVGGHLPVRPGDLANVHRRLQPGRAPGAGPAQDGGHGLALLLDLSRRGRGIRHRRAHHRRGRGALGIRVRRGQRPGSGRHLPARRQQAAAGPPGRCPDLTAGAARPGRAGPSLRSRRIWPAGPGQVRRDHETARRRAGQAGRGTFSGRVRAWPVRPLAGGTGRAIRAPSRASSPRPGRQRRSPLSSAGPQTGA